MSNANTNHGKRATIRGVAHAAGVSIATVSRVLNGRPDVAPDTRETGYRWGSISQQASSASGTTPQAPWRRGIVLAAGAGFVVADAARGAGVHSAALGQQLA